MKANEIQSIYDTNETMNIIGKQFVCNYVASGAIANNDFNNIAIAHRMGGTRDIYSIGADFFSLGLIYGKRLERAKRAHQEAHPLTTTQDTRFYIEKIINNIITRQ